MRTLNKIAMTHPLAVTNCNIDMESLISDQNRSIATLAITTLLKTGNESSVDRLLKQASLVPCLSRQNTRLRKVVSVVLLILCCQHTAGNTQKLVA